MKYLYGKPGHQIQIPQLYEELGSLEVMTEPCILMRYLYGTPGHKVQIPQLYEELGSLEGMTDCPVTQYLRTQQ